MLDTLKKLNDILPNADRWKIGALLVLMLIAAGLEVAGISMILVFVSMVSDPNRLLETPVLIRIMEFSGIESQRDLLIYGAFALIGVFIFKNIYLIILEYCKNTFVFNRFRYIATKLFKRYIYAPYTFHLNRNSAELIRNVTDEARTLASGVLSSLLDMATHVVIALGVIAFLLSIEPFITLIVLGIFGGAGWIFLKTLKQRTRLYGSRSLDARAVMIKRINEGLGGLKDVIITHRQQWFVDQLNVFAQHVAKGEIFRNVAKKSAGHVIEVVIVGSMLLITLILVLQGRDVASTIPVLTLLGVSALRLMPALSSITGSYGSLRYYAHSLKPIHKDLTTETVEVAGGIKKVEKVFLKKKISFHHVSYTYPGGTKPALRDVTLEINKESAVGFVGLSGAGKTTVVDVLLGLLQPDKGKVMVDESGIANNLAGWQQNLGYIPQFIFLSDDTIRNNIAFGIGKDAIDDDKIKNAIQMAQLEEFISTLPDGLDTTIGEQGVRLSGGQRQRIGIARALYHNPEVLVMDEATSSLDNQTERYIINSIERLKRARTIVIIAHRLTTVQNCDRLYLMKEGTIVADGTYSELLNNDKYFQSIAGN